MDTQDTPERGEGKWLVTCGYCKKLVALQLDGTMTPHEDDFPTRACEGGNRRPGDFGLRGWGVR